MSILTTCAACAKPIDHEAPAHCVNCQTRYCSDRCLRYHAHRGGHVDPAATHDDLREAVNTLEETTQTVRRVFGGAHAFTKAIEHQLQDARDALYARGLP
jgi:hypothetical protein